MKFSIPVALVRSLLLLPAIAVSLDYQLPRVLQESERDLSSQFTLLQSKLYADSTFKGLAIAEIAAVDESAVAAKQYYRRGSGRRSIWNG